MGTKVISALTAVTAGNLTGAAVFPVDDATAATRKATLAQLRTNLLAGGSGFTASDPVVCGAVTVTTTSGVQPLAVVGIAQFSRFSRNEAAFGGALMQFDRSAVVAGWIGMDLSDNLTLQRGADAVVAVTVNRTSGLVTLASGLTISASGAAITGGIHVITGGMAVDAGTSAFGDGIRQFGTNVARFENTFVGLPTGATGVGLEIGVSGGGTQAQLQSFNRSVSGFAPLLIQGSTIQLAQGPVLIGTTISTGAAAGNVVVPNGTTFASVNGAGTSVLGMLDMDASNRTRLQLNNAALALNNPVTSASATAGAASALPANPVGYLILTLNGTTNKIPYYAN